MSQDWHIYRGGQQEGPYTWEQLRSIVASGAIRAEDMVWREGMSTWTRVDQVMGLSDLLGPAMAGPPPPGIPPVSYSPGRAAPAQAAARGGATWKVVVAVLAVAVLLLGGCGAAYLLVFREGGLLASRTDAGPSSTASATPTGSPTNEPPVTPTGGATGSEESQPGFEQPKAVVDAFVLATLGGLPNSELDDPKAKSLMTSAYAPEFDTPGFVPLTYGIQDVPTGYEIADETVAGATATVLVLGYWGEDVGREWSFRLEEEGGAWKIAGIDVLDTAGTGDEESAPADAPAQVVDAFVLATLGGLPNSDLDDAKARSLMTSAYAPEFDTPGFVPLTYGIQDVPTSYEIADETVSGSSATVLVLGFWGSDVGRQWSFRLEREDGEWRIAGIDIVESAEAGDQGASPSAFWQLNPTVTEFTVYANGGYKLVVTFDEPAEDVGAAFRIEYRREDDGSLAYDQESSGVIEAGRDKLTLDSDWTGYDLSQMGFSPGRHIVVALIDGVELASGELMVE